MAIYDYEKQIEERIADLKAENRNLDISFSDNYILDVNGTKVQVSILEIKEPMEKDDEKTNMHKIEILFKTKDGYIKIAEVNEDYEIMIIGEGVEKAGLRDKIQVAASNRISLNEREEEKEKDELEDEQGDEEVADEEKPDLKKDVEQDVEEIAKRYNVNSTQVVHISNNKKITKDHRFEGLADFAKDYDDIYIIQGDDPYTWKTIGRKEGKNEEINNHQFQQMAGRNPDITIKRIDGNEIKEIRPLAMYEIDSKTSVAIVRNEVGKPEALFCRQEGGDEKTYWGTVIPEASGKNVYQQEPEAREFMSHRYNSSNDLLDKADELNKAKDMDERGVPSKEKGVQIDEIDGTAKQNRAARKEEIKEDLYRRLGIKEKMKTAMPGYLDYIEEKIDKQAEKILKTMEEDEKADYEETLEKVQKEDDGREEGGFTPDDPRKREH